MENNNKKGLFKSILGIFSRGKKDQKSASGSNAPNDSELIVSPARQVFNRFIERKFAVFAVCVVVFMFLIVLIIPHTKWMEKYYDAFTDTTQVNLPPILSLRTVPKDLRNDIKQIDSYGSFSIGLSNAGKVYLWGVKSVGASGYTVEIPEDVAKADNIAFVAAGQDHCIAIAEDGKFYGWGNNRFGQYARNDDILENINGIEPIPEVVLNGELNVNEIKKVTCGYQASAILMNDGTLYIWGNKKSYANLEKFIGRDDIVDIDFTLNNVVAVDQKQKTIVTGERGLYDVVRTDLDPAIKAIKIKEFIGDRKILELRTTLKNICILLDDGSIAFAGDLETDPVKVPQLEEGERFVDIESGTYHYTGLTNKGNVYSFGGDHYYQTKIPNKVKNANVSKIFAGAFQSYAIDDQSDLVDSWGLKGYLFGTDDRGANILERVIAGGRITMTVGAIAVIIEIIIGVSIGVLAGYFGGITDLLLMRLAEIVSAIPLMPFMIIISALLAQSPLTPTQRLYMIMVVLGVLGWPGFAYITRAQILVARESEYVTAAKAMGVKEKKIAFKHILPNILSVILVQISLAFAGSMLTETSLSWLGFGVVYPQPSWGNMLSKASNATTAINFWWQWVFTSAILILTAVCVNTIGDTLRDVLDPKSNKDK